MNGRYRQTLWPPIDWLVSKVWRLSCRVLLPAVDAMFWIPPAIVGKTIMSSDSEYQYAKSVGKKDDGED